MVFDGVNCILGTGRCKTACWRKQGGNQELVCPDHGKKKMRAAFLQKTVHKSSFFCIRSSKSL
jgi:hypothetical protein